MASSSSSSSTSSFDQLIADLYQVVAEILLIRRPRVQTAEVLTEPPPDLLADLRFDPCPFCREESTLKNGKRLVR